MIRMMNYFCGMVGWRKVSSFISSRNHFQRSFSPSQNLRHALSRVWTWTELEFRLYWMKLCSRGNLYTTAETCVMSYTIQISVLLIFLTCIVVNCWLAYSIVGILEEIYLPFYFFIIDILPILKLIKYLNAFFIRNS